MSKMYIAVLDEFPDYMTLTLVAHSVLAAHLKFSGEIDDYYWGGKTHQYPTYIDWLKNSFKKEFDKILKENKKDKNIDKIIDKIIDRNTFKTTQMFINKMKYKGIPLSKK